MFNCLRQPQKSFLLSTIKIQKTFITDFLFKFPHFLKMPTEIRSYLLQKQSNHKVILGCSNL